MTAAGAADTMCCRALQLRGTRMSATCLVRACLHPVTGTRWLAAGPKDVSANMEWSLPLNLVPSCWWPTTLSVWVDVQPGLCCLLLRPGANAGSELSHGAGGLTMSGVHLTVPCGSPTRCAAAPCWAGLCMVLCRCIYPTGSRAACMEVYWPATVQTRLCRQGQAHAMAESLVVQLTSYPASWRLHRRPLHCLTGSSAAVEGPAERGAAPSPELELTRGPLGQPQWRATQSCRQQAAGAASWPPLPLVQSCMVTPGSLFLHHLACCEPDWWTCFWQMLEAAPGSLAYCACTVIAVPGAARAAQPCSGIVMPRNFSAAAVQPAACLAVSDPSV